MPGLDGTGPLGMGPGTGWGMGWCFGYGGRRRGAPPRGWWGGGFGWGRGWIRGLGRGFAWRRRAVAPPPYEAWNPFGWGAPSAREEAAWLKERAAVLRQQLQNVEKRLEELSRSESS
ncbi:MAG: DUF5320 domain-containing protein [Thermodesulfobacteriota bacterium]